ncbi:hypothetical protein QFZ20_000669 [Flavobacterium sp. W4I14]|nr:hypothetical protein [Flavobacterium sp. W4I14]
MEAAYNSIQTGLFSSFRKSETAKGVEECPNGMRHIKIPNNVDI